MSVILDQKIENTSASVRHQLFAWHQRYSILAVASYNETVASGEVNFFDQDV